jgi:hypothetical protein
MLMHGGYFALTQYLHLVVVLASVYRTVDVLTYFRLMHVTEQGVSEAHALTLPSKSTQTVVVLLTYIKEVFYSNLGRGTR